MDQSPTPAKIQDDFRLNFAEAVKEILAGKKVTKDEWADPRIYGVLDEGLLKLHKTDGKLHPWILNDGDMAGEDYFVIH